MANRIHKHLLKAISKRKENQQVPDTPNSPTDANTQLEQRLDQIIEAKQEPEVEIVIEEDTIKQEYVTLFNKNIDSQKAIKTDEELLTLHSDTINELVNKYCPKTVKPEIQDQIATICNEKRETELLLQSVYMNIETQRQLLINFQLQLNEIAPSEIRDKVIKIIDRKIQLPSYAPLSEELKSIVSWGKYFIDDDAAVINLFSYLRHFILLNNFEYGLISYLKIKQPELVNPYQLPQMPPLLAALEDFISNYPSHGLDKSARFIHHAITYINELVSRGNINEFLSQVSLEQLGQKFSQHFIGNETLLNKLEKANFFEKAKISQNELNNLSNDLNHYQAALNEFGKLKIQLLFIKNDFTVINLIKELHQKINNFDLLSDKLDKLNTFVSTLDDNNQEVKEVLTELLSTLAIIKSAMKQSGVDEYGIESILLFRIARGDFFSLKDRDNLISAIFDMHSSIHPIKLMNNLIDNFKEYSPEKQDECLIFLKNYLLLDTDNSLINVKYEKSEFIDKTDLFIQYANQHSENNDHIESLSNEISEILVQKIVDKTNAFSAQMDMISKGEIPQQQLCRMLNTIAYEISDNLHNNAVIEEFVLKVNFILEAPNLLSNEKTANEGAIQAINNICALLQEHDDFSKLAETISLKLAEILPNTFDEASPATLWDGVLINAQHFDFNKLLFEIISDNKMMFENEKLLLSFVDALESGFIYHFYNINLAQIRNLAWVKDEERLQNGLMPKAINIRNYHQYFNMVVEYISLVMLTQLEKEGVEIVPRESLIEIKKIHEFIEKATMRAIDKGAIATAKALNTVLTSPVIKRLALAKPENETVRNTKIDNSVNSNKLTINIIFEQEGLPYLDTLLDQIVKASARKAGSEFEKKVLVGKVLQLVEEKKHSIKESSTCYDMIEQMISFMNNAELVLQPVFKYDVMLDADKIANFLNSASEYIKPDNYKVYEINDFHTLPGIKNQLSYWLNRMEDFHLNAKHPEDKLIELILAIIDTDDVLEHFSESLDILNIINEISLQKNRTYKNYDHDLHLILVHYHKKIVGLFKSEFIEPSESLTTFFAIFNKDEKIKQYLKKVPAGHNPFSAQHNLKEIVETISKLEKKYIKSIELSNETQGQQAYTQLLLRILEGNTQSPLIQLGNAQEATYTSSKTLLPESEFPVPQAEPEHPDYIGLNRTMDFNPDIKYRSTLELFASSELKKDFMQSFAWAIDNSAVKKLEFVRYSPGINLVSIDHAVEPHLQLNLINYVLLSLDCIGKLAGPTGEYSLQNFNSIKVITDALQEVALMLTYAEIDNEILTTKLDHMIYKLILKNNDLHDMLSQPSSPIRVLPNEDLNNFCHINEYLCHKLLGIPYQKSILSAMDPFTKELDKLDPKIKEDLLRHSGIDVSAIIKLSRKNKTDMSPDANKD